MRQKCIWNERERIMTNSIWNKKNKVADIERTVIGKSGKVYGSSIFCMPDETWCYVEDLLKIEAELEKFKIAQASFGIDAPVDYETACEINNQIMDRNDELKNENKILKRALCNAIERLDGYARLYKGQPSDIPEVTGTYNAVGALSENTLLEIKTILNI